MDEKAFNLIFNSRSVRSIHHRIVIEAIKYLKDDWPDLFLKHYNKLLEGSKAPDKKFKDYRNHVCHMPEVWGGAVDATIEWFNKTAEAFKNKDWEKAIYSAGVMSHYYADVNHPFHTGQTEEECVIHSFTEWGAAEIYKTDLREMLNVQPPIKDFKIKDLVIDSASKSHKIYEFMLENYNMKAGQEGGWGKGYAEPLKKEIAKVLSTAIQGTASLFIKAIEGSKTDGPGEIKLGLKRATTRLTNPVERYRISKDIRKKKRRTRKMKKEYIKTGKVEKHLLPDDKDYLKALKNGEIKPVILKQKKIAVKREEPKVTPKITTPKKEEPKLAPTTTEPKKKKRKWKAAITLESKIDDAAEVGASTAKRLRKIGIINVANFIDKTPREIFKQLKDKLNYTRLDLTILTRMSTETQMMLDIPRLRTHDAVILYQAGIKSKDALAKEKPETLWNKVQKAVKDAHIQKFLRKKSLQPDFEEVGEWIESAQ